MDPAVISLLGLVVGGILAGGTALLTERARSKRELELQRTQSSNLARTAARLVYDELDEIELFTAGAASRKAWDYRWDPPSCLLPRVEWETHRATLATHLDDAAWGLVSAAYAELGRIEDCPVRPSRKSGGWASRSPTQLRPGRFQRIFFSASMRPLGW